MKNIIKTLIIFTITIGCSKRGNEFRSSENDRSKELYQLGDSLYFKVEYGEAIERYKEAIAEIVNPQETNLISNLNNDIGLSFKKLGSYDSAIYYYQRAAAVDQSSNDSTSLVGRWRNIANVYKNMGLYSDAVVMLNKALLLINEDDRLNKARIFNSLGGIFLQQERYEQASTYYKYALVVFREIQQEKNIGLVLNNLGLVAEGLNKLDSALYYYQASYAIKLKVDSTSTPSTIHNIGSVFQKMEQFDSSQAYFIQANAIRERIGDERAVTLGKLAMAKNNILTREVKGTMELLDQSYSYASEADNQDLLVDCYQNYAALYELIGDDQRSLDYLKKWSGLKDSLFNQEKLKSIDYRYQFESDRFEREKRLLNQEAELTSVQLRTNRIILAILVLFVLFLAVFIYVVLRQRRSLRLLNLDLKAQNQKIEVLNKQNFHFTRNSLSGIVSMLNKQIRKADISQVKSILMEEKLRMESINILYQQLFYTSGSEVNVRSFLTNIVNNTLETMLPEREVDAQIAVNENSTIQNEQALNVGLIVNEICINACKYALNVKGHFFLNWKESKGGNVLEIGDRGGQSGSVDVESTSSFGLQLIKLLTEELGGQIKTKKENGLAYEISF